MAYLSSTIAGAAAGIFGTKRLVSGYAGHGVQLRRESDNTTQNFDFTAGASGDDLDASAIATFSQSSNLRIVTWYDQSSQGNNLTQPTNASQPVLEVGSTFQENGRPSDGFPVVYFNEPTTMLGSGWFDCATGTFSNQNVSVLSVARFNDFSTTQQNGGPGGIAFRLGLASSSDCSIFTDYIRVHTLSPVQQMFTEFDNVVGGAFPSSGHTYSWRMPNENFNVASVRNNGSGIKARFGNWRSETMSAGNSSTGLTGFRVGASFGTNIRFCGVATAFILCTALSDSDEQSGMDTLATIWSLTNTPNKMIAVVGDSISSAHLGSTWLNRIYSWFYSTTQTVGQNAVYYNMAFDGGFIQQNNTNNGTESVEFGPQSPDSLDPLLDANKFNQQVLIVFGGTNDIDLFNAAGQAPGYGSTVHTNLQNYCLARRAAGWKIVVVDSIPMGTNPASEVTERNSFNSLIAANWQTYADAFAQVSALNWVPGGDWTANYQSDQIHPNTAGQAMLANTINPVVFSLVSTVTISPSGVLGSGGSVSTSNFNVGVVPAGVAAGGSSVVQVVYNSTPTSTGVLGSGFALSSRVYVIATTGAGIWTSGFATITSGYTIALTPVGCWGSGGSVSTANFNVGPIPAGVVVSNGSGDADAVVSGPDVVGQLLGRGSPARSLRCHLGSGIYYVTMVAIKGAYVPAITVCNAQFILRRFRA